MNNIKQIIAEAISFGRIYKTDLNPNLNPINWDILKSDMVAIYASRAIDWKETSKYTPTDGGLYICTVQIEDDKFVTALEYNMLNACWMYQGEPVYAHPFSVEVLAWASCPEPFNSN